MSKKIGVVGDKDSVLGFRALGVDAFPVTSRDDAVKTLLRLAKEDYAVILITESTAKEVPDIIDRYRTSAYPIMIPIPGNRGSLNYGLDQVKQNAERAVGADILFGKEG